MKKINKSRFVILGMLFEKPKSGYSILQMIRQSTTYFWQESDSSIYPMLKILENEGKVTSRSESTGKRERNIFEITEDGKKEFLAWMALPAEKESNRNELLLKLFFGGITTTQEVTKQLYLRLIRAQETKEKFKKLETDVLAQIPDEHSHKVFWMLTLRNGILRNEAELKWLNESIKILEKK